MTYNDVEKAAIAVGSALLNLPGCLDILHFQDEEYEPARQMRLLGMFTKNCVEWFICEQAGTIPSMKSDKKIF